MPFLDPEAPNLLTSIRGAQSLKGGREITLDFACNGTSHLMVPEGAVCALVS